MSIEVRRRLPAAAAEVFRWWTESDRLAAWMTPVGSAEVKLDLRVGGQLRVVMRGEGITIEHHGRFIEIDPPKRLVFTWSSAFTGHRESVVTVDFTPAGEDATEIRLVQSALPARADDSHRGGWQTMIDRLIGALERTHAR